MFLGLPLVHKIESYPSLGFCVNDALLPKRIYYQINSGCSCSYIMATLYYLSGETVYKPSLSPLLMLQWLLKINGSSSKRGIEKLLLSLPKRRGQAW